MEEEIEEEKPWLSQQHLDIHTSYNHFVLDIQDGEESKNHILTSSENS